MKRTLGQKIMKNEPAGNKQQQQRHSAPFYFFFEIKPIALIKNSFMFYKL